MSRTRVAILTLLAMLAFAGNSLLCRMALKHTAIDPATLHAATGFLVSAFQIAFLACAVLAAGAFMTCLWLRDLPLKSTEHK